MKLACWNVRGFHKPLKQKSAQSILCAHKLDVFGVLESKFDDKALNSMLRVRFRGMNAIHNFHLSTKGRIFLLWNPSSVDLDVICMSDQFIHVRINCLKTKFSFLASFVYGFNSICQRRLLWKDLLDIGINCHIPWMVLGDFNNVLSPDEKLGGLQVKNYEINDFADCVNSLDLSDLHHIGCYYTWLSHQVCSKLDRVLVNNYWLTSNISAIAEFVAPGCVSDHTLSIVDFLDTTAPKKKPFKFYNMWALSENFENLVYGKWKCRGGGTAQYRLKQMFKFLKKPLLLLNRNQFSHISSRASKAKCALEDMQKSLLIDGVSQPGYKDVKRKAEFLLEAERLFIAQKAKIKYTLEGDRCTKFFHDLVKRNTKKNAIVALKNSDGCTITDVNDIANEFIIFYKNLLGSQIDTEPIDRDFIGGGQIIPMNMWSELTQQPTRSEVDEALFAIDNDKAPGSDGYGAFFFKNAWHIIGSDVARAVFEFFRNGQLLKQWNHSIISLIPKMAGASSVNDYRPISCCTVFYKIISKMLVNRLRKVMGHLVDGAQAGFIEGRSIVDNIHLAQELLRKYARKRGSPRCMLKIDLQKAYDSVDWSFLRQALIEFNFPSVFVKWIMECVSTTSYSIVINGQFHGHFEGRRGLRQGDPLSPYLFTLCIEILSRGLKRMSRDTRFGFHPKCRNLGITHLAYADDLLLLSRGDVYSVAMLMSSLNKFGNMAGLRVNLLKSNAYIASVTDTVRQEILDITGFTCGDLPFRYLGVPLASKHLRAADFSILVDAISSKINSWPRQSLSYAGKFELIRSVVQGVECYWLSILPLPSCVIDSIYSKCRSFVWPSKHPPIAWISLCKPIEAGGFGLKNLKAWNKALLAKTLWNIHIKKDCLWIKWINHVYCNSADVWSWGWCKDHSPLIKQVIAIRDEILAAHGSKHSAVRALEKWFGCSKGLSGVYDFFVGRWVNWPWKPLVSKQCILPKHKFILWLLAHRKLLTRDRLGYLSDKACVLCNTNDESANHLFFKCKLSESIWTDIRSWLGMKKLMGSPTSVLAAFRGVYRGSSSLNKMRCVALAATVYHIWSIRNMVMFENEVPNIAATIAKIKIHVLRSLPNSIDMMDNLL